MTSRRTRERLIQRLRDGGIDNPAVLDCMQDLPRHLFIDEALAHRAYEDTALPIGCGQTISQPYVVARMTELILAQGTPERVLEIGTGCGYQTAVLARLVPQVFTVERLSPLLAKARARFRELGLRNVIARHADGRHGWPEKAPFNAILSTAAPATIPDKLLTQLAPDGILVIPVGDKHEQQLQTVVRQGHTERFKTQNIESVRFVPLHSGLDG